MEINLNQIMELISKDLSQYTREELESYIRRICKRTLTIAQEREYIRKDSRLREKVLMGANDYLVARVKHLEDTLQTLVASSRNGIWTPFIILSIMFIYILFM